MSTKTLQGKQLSIFDLLGVPEPDEASPYTKRIAIRRRTKAAKRKGKGKGKGLQYKIKLRVRKSERVLEFRRRTTEVSGNSETATWSDEAIKRLHYCLLIDSLMTLRHLSAGESDKAAEIILWMLSDSTGAFSYRQSVAIAAEISVQPDFVSPYKEVDVDLLGIDYIELRSMCLNLARRKYGQLPNFFDRLVSGIRDAADGSQKALEWCLSQDGVGPLSFKGCCEALGFEAAECLDLIGERKKVVRKSVINKQAYA